MLVHKLDTQNFSDYVRRLL